LIAIVNVDGEQVVQFSHFSVREYLTSSRIAISEDVSHFHVLPKLAHALLARACLSVLLQLDYNAVETQTRHFPLAIYAAEHWADHAQFEDSDVSSDIRDGMERLFDRDQPLFTAWIWVHDIDYGRSMLDIHLEEPFQVPLYHAALFGFYDIAERIISKHPRDVNGMGGYHSTPLHGALAKGHLDIALLLLKHGANAKAPDWRGLTPLCAASGYVYTEVVQALLDRGAGPDEECRYSYSDEDDATPLCMASRKGRPEVAQTLLQHRARVDHRNAEGRTPLHIASEEGHNHLVSRYYSRTAQMPTRRTTIAKLPCI
jgi:hypothetical protein